jgi:hypothetical protein
VANPTAQLARDALQPDPQTRTYPAVHARPTTIDVAPAAHRATLGAGGTIARGSARLRVAATLRLVEEIHIEQTRLDATSAIARRQGATRGMTIARAHHLGENGRLGGGVAIARVLGAVATARRRPGESGPALVADMRIPDRGVRG